MSHVTCVMSCHATQLFFFFFKLLGDSWWMVCYQWGRIRLEFNLKDIGLGWKCQNWKISAHADAAPGAHFQKLDAGINN